MNTVVDPVHAASADSQETCSAGQETPDSDPQRGHSARHFHDTGTIIHRVDRMVFYADRGGIYGLENVGRSVDGECVRVEGMLETNGPGHDRPRDLDGMIRRNTIEPASQRIDVVGVLVRGPDKPLLRADNGMLYVVNDSGDFDVGDRVRVTGMRVPLCVTIYEHGDACILNDTITRVDSSSP